nr:hypothetical protein [Tanacetum cinerariifolium]
MKGSDTYKTYYAFAGKEILKPKYVWPSTKKKIAQPPKASLVQKLKTTAKVAKSAEQIKLATKRRKKDFHMSHASGSSDGVDFQSKVPDEQHQKVTGTNKGASVRSEVPDVPNYASESDEESWTFRQDEDDDDEKTDLNNDTNDEEEEKEKTDDDDEVSPDHRVYTPPDHQLTNEMKTKKAMTRLRKVDSTMKTIIKEEVQAQVSKIMPKIEKYVIESLRAEALVRSTNQPQTSYAVAASLSEFELKKILIAKMEENQSVYKLDIQKNLYNALVESYNSDKDIFSSYGDVLTLKRGRDDQDKDKDPSVGSNQGSKRRRSGKEAESLKEPTHKESKYTSSSKDASRYQPKSTSKSAQAEEHSQKVDDLEDQSHQEFNTGNDDETSIRESLDVDKSQWNPSSSPTPDREWHKTKTVDKRPP